MRDLSSSLAAAFLVALTTVAIALPDAAAITARNALERRVLSELKEFTDWLDANDARGIIGEVGWPGDRGRRGWNRLGRKWFSAARSARLLATMWATGEWWPRDYPLLAYSNSRGSSGVDHREPQARVLEEVSRAGVNVAGAEFGAPTTEPTSEFSNQDPGTAEVDYHYESRATFRYLSRRGIDVVRLPFRWERLQPSLFGGGSTSPGQLDPEELGRLKAVVARAGAAGLEVILDMHNYGAYYTARDGRGVRRALGSPGLPVAAFADVWGRISLAFRDDDTVFGYGLMNEPVGLPDQGDGRAGTWEKASQAALTRIRAIGDEHLVLVAGYGYSGVQTWAANHPRGWIDDPIGNFRYEAHHYWDADHSGRYHRSYANEVAAAERAESDARDPGLPVTSILAALALAALATLLAPRVLIQLRDRGAHSAG